MSLYTVSARGPVPSDLCRKLAEAHAKAIRARQQPERAHHAPQAQDGQSEGGKSNGS